MSVMDDDATGHSPSDHLPVQPADDTGKMANWLIDEPSLPQAEPANQLDASGEIDASAFPQATIALNVSDVIDLGTESVDGIEALIIHGASGDTVRLANESGYLWERAETCNPPEGYDIYQASSSHSAGAVEPLAVDHSQPIYVLVQQDLTVILETA